MSRTSSDPSRNGLRSRTCPVDWFVSRTVASRLAGVYPWSWMFREPVATLAITRLSHQPLEVAVRKADLPEHRQVVVRPLLDGGEGHPVVELRGGAVAGEEAGLADDADCRSVGQGALDPDLDHSTDRIHRERERLGRQLCLDRSLEGRRITDWVVAEADRIELVRFRFGARPHPHVRDR